MHRLLLADASGVLSKAISKQIKNQFVIECCDNGERALKLLKDFDPDIFLIDLQLPCVDGLTVLRTLRRCGMTTKIIAILSFSNDHILRELELLNVSCVYLKPCHLGAVINCIRDLNVQLETSVCDEWNVENEADRILVDLGFYMSPSRYYIVTSAVLYMYDYPNCYVTKCLYPAIAKPFNGTTTQVEKAIRDAIKNAKANGNQAIWQMYFPPGKEGKSEYPSNEVFLGRIANVLQSREKLRKPWDDTQKIAR